MDQKKCRSLTYNWWLQIGRLYVYHYFEEGYFNVSSFSIDIKNLTIRINSKS